MWELGWTDKNWLAFEHSFKQLLIEATIYDQHKGELEGLINKEEKQTENTTQSQLGIIKQPVFTW